MLELELKAVATDPVALGARLIAAGAVLRFRGMLRDRRYDRDGCLRERDEVLRLRRHEPREGEPLEELAWKGPTTVQDGYKARQELAARLAPGEDVAPIVEALGYAAVHAIDRFVEVYQVAGAEVRVEWYPELDTLVEVEGMPEAIERAIAATGLTRDAFRAEPLDTFVAEFTARTGRTGRIALTPDESPPHWPA